MNVLVLNPGGNSLKAELVATSADHAAASAGRPLGSVIVEGIGASPCLSVMGGKHTLREESVAAANYAEAATSVLSWFQRNPGTAREKVDCVGVRVVHGGRAFNEPALITKEVESRIHDFERLAPLHNKSSLELLGPLRQHFRETPLYAVFDTAFHNTIPDVASLYAIPGPLAEKHGIRRYGFHGTSHRYLMNRASEILKRPAQGLNLVTMHLESGCSVSAIAKGKSIDNTMGFTPLEGVMMGTRSGDVDPSLVEFLVREEKMTVSDVMKLLNKQSGLLGISGQSLDTRVLMKSYGQDARVTLAMDMFSYRVVKAVGACAAALGGVDALVFGGGIGENTPLVRERVARAFQWCGLDLDSKTNQALVDGEGLISNIGSSLQALVVVTQEGLQIAHECCRALAKVS